MNAPLRRHEWQGTGSNGKAMRLSNIEPLLGDQRRPVAASESAPMWLRQLRADTRPFLV